MNSQGFSPISRGLYRKFFGSAKFSFRVRNVRRGLTAPKARFFRGFVHRALYNGFLPPINCGVVTQFFYVYPMSTQRVGCRIFLSRNLFRPIRAVVIGPSIPRGGQDRGRYEYTDFRGFKHVNVNGSSTSLRSPQVNARDHRHLVFNFLVVETIFYVRWGSVSTTGSPTLVRPYVGQYVLPKSGVFAYLVSNVPRATSSGLFCLSIIGVGA